MRTQNIINFNFPDGVWSTIRCVGCGERLVWSTAAPIVKITMDKPDFLIRDHSINQFEMRYCNNCFTDFMIINYGHYIEFVED